MDEENRDPTTEEMAEAPAPVAEDAVVEPEPGPEAESQGAETRLAELEAAIAEQEARLQEAESSAKDLQAGLQEREARIAALGRELEQARELLAAAVVKYRAALLTASPDIPEELVRGQSLEEVEASLAEARRVVERIRSSLEKQAASARTPLGAPVRTGPDLSALSPQEKIAYALGQR